MAFASGAHARGGLKERMVCEVAFMEWTHHGHIRHPSYQGLRPDKNPAEVRREVATDPPALPRAPSLARGN
jgi:ATP-dependent DNA ligase